MNPLPALAAGVPAALCQVCQAPAIAMGMSYVAMAHSLGLAMDNAVANQQRGQVLADAALAQVLAMILAKGASP